MIPMFQPNPANAGLIFNLPLSDAGAGVANTTPASSSGSGTPTFTRATTAWTKLSTGLWASVASGSARYSYLGLGDSAVGAAGGYFVEGARTNLLTFSNDFTNAAWAKVTMTTAMTSTGPDGVANSATRLTAAGALSTILQLLVAAASDRTWSVWARRITGTGTIKLFQGATKTADLASSLNGTTYTRIQQDATVDVTLLGVGIEIGTDTDAIDVWCGQFEAGAFASSPIPTTTVSVTRNADALTYVASGNANAVAQTTYLEYTPSNSYAVGVTAGNGSNYLIDVGGNQNAMAYYNGNLQAIIKTNQLVATTPWSLVGGTTYKAASTFGPQTQEFLSGVAGSPNVLSGNTIGTNITVGNNDGIGNSAGGTIKNIRIYGKALSAAQLQAMTA